jgi:hypothetical protein
VTGRELRAWRKRWFKDREDRWSVFAAADWAGVPEAKWLRWERLGSTRHIPAWLVDRMTDPYLSPDKRLRPRSDVERQRREREIQRLEDLENERRYIESCHAQAIKEDERRSRNPHTIGKGR